MSRTKTDEDLQRTFITLRDRKLLTSKNLGFVFFVLAAVVGIVPFAEARQNNTKVKIEKLVEEVAEIKKKLNDWNDNGGSTLGASTSVKEDPGGMVKELQGHFENAKVAAAKDMRFG